MALRLYFYRYLVPTGQGLCKTLNNFLLATISAAVVSTLSKGRATIFDKGKEQNLSLREFDD